MTAFTVRRLPNLATPEQLWSGTWESNPVPLRSERSGLAVFLAPEIRNLKLGRPIRIRTGISAFGGLGPVPLDDGPETIGVAGGNRILVDGSTDRRLSTRPRPHSVPATPGELGGRGGNRTPICWLQASRPAVERLPQFLEPEGVVETPTSALRERRSSA